MADIKTYTVKEAEEILKVKGRAIRDYIKNGKLKASKIGRGWVIKKEDLEKFIEQNS
jgi:excisionase family DNA binding protein